MEMLILNVSMFLPSIGKKREILFKHTSENQIIGPKKLEQHKLSYFKNSCTTSHIYSDNNNNPNVLTNHNGIDSLVWTTIFMIMKSLVLFLFKPCKAPELHGLHPFFPKTTRRNSWYLSENKCAIRSLIPLHPLYFQPNLSLAHSQDQ